MVKKSMKKNSLQLCTLIVSVFVLFNSACGQNPPAGKAYLDEEHLAEQSTVLLNNSSYFVPLQDLQQLKIASIHFSNTYAVPFDSLLSKYAKVDLFAGGDYTGAKTLNDLSADLR